MTDQQFRDWLISETALRCILVEVDVKRKADGVVETRYLSTRGYVTSGSDAPANTTYLPVVAGGIKFTQSISLTGDVSLSLGDIELNNFDASLDDWLDDYWTNRNINIFIGDMTWVRSDFRQIFSGVTFGIDSRKRDRINIKLSDKLQRLNTPVTEVKLGGASTNKDQLLPLCFGECHNVEPLLTDNSLHEYQVHNGAIEDVIEVRDNGVPVSITEFLTTGKFRLSNSPYGQITASVQGAAVSANILTQSQTFNQAPWTLSAATLTSGFTAPDGTTTAFKLVEDSTNAAHNVNQPTSVSLSTGEYVLVSFYAKAGERTTVRAQCSPLTRYGNPNGVVFNLATGTVDQIVGSGISNAGMYAIGNGWYRCWLKAVPISFPAGLTVIIGLSQGTTFSYAGDGTSGAYIWGAQAERNVSFPNKYTVTTTSSLNVYPKTVGALVAYLVMTYGNSSLKFAYSDLDMGAIEAFDFANPQPVGLYLKDRANVLEEVNRLAASIGARLVVSSNGLLSLVRLTLPQSSTGTIVTSSDIAEKTLEVSQLPPVVAGWKVGYCKNWTVQDTLATGLVEEHRVLFSEEWLTFTQTDSAAAANFNLYTEPDITETLLLTAADASAEAARRLNIFNTQRKVMKYRGYANLLLETLGSPQTLQHSRFGLSAGVTGQIISITTDWINQRVDFEVLI